MNRRTDGHTYGGRFITSWFLDRISLEVIRRRLELIRKRLEVIRLEVIRTRKEVTRTSWFPGGRRVGEISNKFDILLTQHGTPGNYN